MTIERLYYAASAAALGLAYARYKWFEARRKQRMEKKIAKILMSRRF